MTAEKETGCDQATRETQVAKILADAPYTSQNVLARAYSDAVQAAKLNTEQAYAEEDLRKFANSHTRAQAIVGLFRVRHPRRVVLLGAEWSGCDTYPKAMKRILLDMPRPASDAMTPEENRFLAELPETIDVWRGCYEHNRKGFSWTIDRETAKRFTTLMRYHHPGIDPLLLQGRVRRNDIIFVKLDRNELEVVPRPGAVEIVAEEHLEAAA